MNKQKILVVDDEPDIVDLIAYNLKKEGYEVTTCSDGIEALKLLEVRDFDLLILDIMLPGTSGMDICITLRRNERTCGIPIIMVTAKNEEIDRVLGLEIGADDYISKPFSVRELIARIKAVLRRYNTKKNPLDIVTCGDICIDKASFTAFKKDSPLRLSPTEFKLLLYLAEHKGRVFSRSQLLDAVWKDETFVEPRTVDVHIRRIRAHIEDNPAEPSHIKTRRSIGYYMNKDS